VAARQVARNGGVITAVEVNDTLDVEDDSRPKKEVSGMDDYDDAKEANRCCCAVM
jgi:hypothetical protein